MMRSATLFCDILLPDKKVFRLSGAFGIVSSEGEIYITGTMRAQIVGDSNGFVDYTVDSVLFPTKKSAQAIFEGQYGSLVNGMDYGKLSLDVTDSPDAVTLKLVKRITITPQTLEEADKAINPDDPPVPLPVEEVVVEATNAPVIRGNVSVVWK